MNDVKRCLVAAVMLAALPAVAESAQVGGVVAWHDDADLGIGAWASFPVDAISEQVSGVAEFVYYFPDEPANVDFSYWELNGNLYHDFTLDSDQFTPYAGGGINIAHGSGSTNTVLGEVSASDTDVGINLIGGLAFRTLSYEPFIEMKFEIGGGESFVISAGASLPFGD